MLYWMIKSTHCKLSFPLMLVKIPTYTAKMERSTQAKAKVANLLTNLTPMNTIVPMTTSNPVPYTRKLLYMALASFVKSPKSDKLGAMYVWNKMKLVNFNLFCAFMNNKWVSSTEKVQFYFATSLFIYAGWLVLYKKIYFQKNTFYFLIRIILNIQ